MSSHATADAGARLAAPRRLKRKPSMLALAWRIHRNSLGAWTDEAYREDFIVRHMLFRRVFVANSPEAAKHVLLDRADNYVKSRIARQVLKPLGQGLLTSEGALWRRQRRTLAPAFHPKRLEAFTPAMVQATVDVLEGWKALPAGSVIDAAEAMAGLTLDVITRTMFSSDIRERAAEVRASLIYYQRVAGRPSLAGLLGLPGWFPRLHGRRVRETTAALDEIIFGIIERRRREGGPAGSQPASLRHAEEGAADEAPADDLLGLLLAARDEESGEGMSDVQLRDEIATIFTAGHETTANALTWTWYLLSLHPQAEARLFAELAAVLGGRLPENDDIARLRYTRMVLEESLRLYPPAHTLSREALGDDEILGHHVPAGSAVLVVPWLLHRHEKLWERPEVFDPERFAPERGAARPRYAYLPFGGGPRICIGAGFAMQEATLILATVAPRYRLRLVPGQRVEPLGLITLRPKGGLLMALEKRAN